MRDPERIDIICDAIKEYWHKVPDWRLGQMLVNAIRPTRYYPDLFYVEDNELLALMHNMMEPKIDEE